MSIRIPIGSAAALFEEGATDFAPAPEKVVRFADTTVDFIAADDNSIRLGMADTVPAQTRNPNRHYH